VIKKTKDDFEKQFIVMLINFRDYFLEKEPLEQVDLISLDAVNNLIIGYFCERRSRVPIPSISIFMNHEDIANFINDEVLDYIKDEHPGFLETDWMQRYVVKSEDNCV